MLNVLLAEDHNIVRNGIRMLLETDSDINILGESVNGREVLDFINSGQKVDVVLADINMPELDGISLVRELKILSPDTKVVILSMHDTEQYVIEAFVAGAAGYLLKNVSADELIFSLKHISSGGRYVCAELAMFMMNKVINEVRNAVSKDSSAIDFSPREIEVLNLIAEGLTNLEMSEKLFISKRTIEGHRQSLIDKTGSRNTATLIRYAVSNGLIQ